MSRSKEIFVFSVRQGSGWRNPKPVVTAGQGNQRQTTFWRRELELEGSIESLVRHHDPLSAQRAYGDENPVTEVVANLISPRHTDPISEIARFRGGAFEFPMDSTGGSNSRLNGEIKIGLLKAS